MTEMEDLESIQLAKKWYEDFGALSPVFLQRKLKISYNQALKLIEEVVNQVNNSASV